MGVLTSFLKLFKPAPNDYVDVEKHLNENYDKIDTWAKGLVVNDLTTGGTDKAGSAEMVKKLGEDKQDKTDNELETDSKEIVGAINESLWSIIPHKIGNSSTTTNILEWAVTANLGFYVSQSSNNKFEGLPEGCGNSFELFLNGIQYGFGNYRTMFIKAGNSNIWVNTQESSDGISWIGWKEILTEKSKLFLGNVGLDNIKFIQNIGAKTRGQGYYDKTTKKIYICSPEDITVNSVDDVTVTRNFKLATNINNAKKGMVVKLIADKVLFGQNVWNEVCNLPDGLSFIFVKTTRTNQFTNDYLYPDLIPTEALKKEYALTPLVVDGKELCLLKIENGKLKSYASSGTVSDNYIVEVLGIY